MSDALGFGVVGCGRMGRRRAATVAGHPSSRLVGVADADGAAARNVAQEHRCATHDIRELLTHPDIDTVFICTPNKFHRPLAVAAMQAGKNVICEKPLARTPAEAAAMVLEAEATGTTLKVGANLRFFSTVSKALELVESGRIGKVFSVRGWIGNGGWQRDTWFADPELAGGGTVLDNGCHLFDLVRLLLGDVTTCCGQASALHWDLDVEDNGAAIFTTADGRMASVNTSWTEWREYFSLEIYGSDGLVSVDNRLPTMQTLLHGRNGNRQVFDFAEARRDPYAAELASYLDARDQGRRPEPDGHDGLCVVEMAHAVYASSRRGERVAVGQRLR